MEFKISKEEFLKGLGRVQSIIERKTALPILSNVLVDASENGIEIVATDLEVGIKGRYKAQIKSEGTITVAAKKLHEVIRELPEEDLKFETTGNDWVKITSGRATFKMVGLSADDYPMLPNFETEEFVSLPASLIGEMLEMVQYAIAVDDNRYSLTGVYVTIKEANTGRNIRMVGTDGHRLAYIERPLADEIAIEIPSNVILPRKGINEMRKLLAEAEGDIQLCFKDHNMVMKKDNLLYIIRLIDGEFPDYEQVVPRENDKHLTVNREMFAAALKRCSLFSLESSRGVKLEISRKTLEITSSDPNLGEAREELPVIYEGDPLTIGFNAKFFLDVLTVAKDEDVHIELSQPLAPGLIKLPSESGFLAVVMPMRI